MRRRHPSSASKPDVRLELAEGAPTLPAASPCRGGSSACHCLAAPLGRVPLDADLLDLLPEFLENRRRDARELRQLAEECSFDAISRIAHRMKGSGGSYGVPELSALGAELESAAGRGRLACVLRLQRRMESYLEEAGREGASGSQP